MSDLETLRRFYARLITARTGVSESRIIEAFGQVRREDFLGEGPWSIMVNGGYISTDTDDPAVLYQDILVGLAPERGINNGEPSLHARCIAEADPQPGNIVLHVGAGSGYYTAILAHLAGPDGQVIAYEIDADLAHRAASNLATSRTITVIPRSGLEASLPLADVIYVSAGATHVPLPWLDALAPQGRLVLPLTPNEGLGCMVRIQRHTVATYSARIFSPAGFIPCIGARDAEQSKALAVAIATRPTEDVRSLRRNSEPDATAWCVGAGWWLSTAEP